MGKQSTLIVINEFFRGQPAHALDETAFDLADVDGRVDGAPYVVKDIDAAHLHLSGQNVDHDLTASCSIGVIEERPAFALFTIPMQFRRLVESGGRQMYPRGIGLLRQFAERNAFVADEDAVVAE